MEVLVYTKIIYLQIEMADDNGIQDIKFDNLDKMFWANKYLNVFSVPIILYNVFFIQ